MPEQVKSVNFTITEKGAMDPTSPKVSFDPSKNRVRIEGTMWAGNACHEATLESMSYDAKVDELSVLVAVKKVDSGCPDSTGTNTYEVKITLQSHLPETVTATQRDAEKKTETTTASPP